MLGYAINTAQGAGDDLLSQVAESLVSQGFVLAGVLQSNYVFDPERRCHMDLTVLGQGPVIRISQDRGRHARGCRLDPQALALAVHQVAQALDQGGADLVIVNKFGKAEAEGEGFRDVIGKALLADVPVLTTVLPGNLATFLEFAGPFAIELPADPALIVGWCLAQRGPGTDRRSA